MYAASLSAVFRSSGNIAARSVQRWSLLLFVVPRICAHRPAALSAYRNSCQAAALSLHPVQSRSCFLPPFWFYISKFFPSADQPLSAPRTVLVLHSHRTMALRTAARPVDFYRCSARLELHTQLPTRCGKYRIAPYPSDRVFDRFQMLLLQGLQNRSRTFTRFNVALPDRIVIRTCKVCAVIA